ncbi:MAG: KEOPS complex subunit Cgi121 [Nitrososphaerales archaeon]
MEDYRLIKIDKYWLLFAGLKLKEDKKVKDLFKIKEDEIIFQLINPRVFVGEEHLFAIISQFLEAKKRSILYTLKPELDLLIRFSLCDQIKEALDIAGVKDDDKEFIFIALGEDERKLKNFYFLVLNSCITRRELLEVDSEKLERIKRLFKISDHVMSSLVGENERKKLSLVLAERASLLYKD